jgi:hypothetical protein
MDELPSVSPRTVPPDCDKEVLAPDPPADDGACARATAKARAAPRMSANAT